MAGMKPTRKSRRTTENFGILVNQSAANYDHRVVDDLITEIKRKRANFSIAEPSSAMGLMQRAQTMAGLRRIRGSRSAEEHRRGKITKLVVCGGDGTFNLAARAALKEGALALAWASRRGNAANSAASRAAGSRVSRSS